MSKAVLIIGFKYGSTTALNNALIQKYYTDKQLTVALPNTDPTTDTARATYYTGSIYENWYGWTPTQKYNAYKQARQAADTAYNAAKTTINSYIRKFNTGSEIIVGYPIMELNDTSNAYKILVSQIPTSSSDPNYTEAANCITLQLDSNQTTIFKNIVSALKTTEKPKFYCMNATTSSVSLT